MFDKILIANRGEIALRVLRACQGDGHRHRRGAFRPPTRRRCTCSWPTRASASARRRRANRYLNIPAISPPARSPAPTRSIPATASSSENARFAEIVEEHGITFIGPKPEHIRLMGDKIDAKRTAAQARHPLRARLGRRDRRRGRGGQDRRRDRLSGADQGGGRRRRPRHEGRQIADELADALSGARPRRRRRSATTRSISRSTSRKPRHIEFQVLADGKGDVDPSGRTRLLAAAPPPEGVGGRPVAGAQRGAARGDRRRLRAGDGRARLPRRRHDRVPLRGRRASTSSR